MMRKIITLLFCLACLQYSNAQSMLSDSVTSELYKINNLFDSSEYLGFNMDIYYRGDSAGVTTETDRVAGNYVLNRHNLYYNMDGTEYVQTDSFSYTIYDAEKTMVMTKNFINGNSTVFPLKAFVDSIVHSYGSAYTLALDTVMVDSVNYYKRIKFTSNGTVDVAYNYFYIDYNVGSYLPVKFEFAYNEPNTSGDSTASYTYILAKTITMNFSNYRAFVQTGIFDDIRYVWYNRQRKIYEPSEKYREYKFVTAGFDNEDIDAHYYREVPYNN